MSFTYSYTEPVGDGVDIYIVDTGVYVDNVEFEGRATFGYAAGQYQKEDGHGHGTHCAGTAAGKTYGVAKKASIIGVKVLSDNGQGSTADIVDGINWVLTNVKTTGKPSIASMSLGGGVSQALDDAVSQLIAGGVQVAVAAGNDGADASNSSPARVQEAITVGASNIVNAMASFSNFGSVVDVFAPGVNITSAWIPNPTSIKMISGTSMATPQVAGLAAYFLSKDTTLTPAAIVAKITSLATQNAITGVPSGTTGALAFNGGADGSTGSSSSSSSSDVPTSTDADPTPSSTDSDASSSASSTSSDPATPTETSDSLFTCPDWWKDCPLSWSRK
jgi:cerevisin